MKQWIIGFVLLTTCLSAQERSPLPHESPEQIQEELNDAETQFKHAQEMFNPWYAGPLLTGSASMMPPGMGNIQPYLFATDNYAVYTSKRKVQDVPDLWSVNPQVIVQAGLTSWLDLAFLAQTQTNSRHRTQSTFLGDTSLFAGFKILKQGLWVPGIKVGLNETFPSGKYKNLKANRNGTDSTGGGSYVTGLSLKFGKLLFWSYKHPMNLRLTMTYNIPSTVQLRGLNSYGGGIGTSGKVRPGNNFNASFGMEYSFTQRWVFATDVVYQVAARTKFTGTPGLNPNGTPALNGSGSNDQLSLAPAIEYNPNPNLGILGGVWFSVYGRNSSDFLSGIISVTYTFNFVK
jgi:hypothetical protein